MSSVQHHHSSSFPPSDDSFWEVPRLYKDKIYRDNSRSVTGAGPPPRRRVGLSESPKRVTLLDYKSKSSTAVPTFKSFGSRLSPSSSVDMSTSRFSLDGKSLSGSLHSQPDRPESIAQNLRAKGSRLIRRQNSKFNLRTLEWVEGSDEPWTHGYARHNGITSTGNSTRPQISKPYNFQHLTHTHSRHFQQMSRASHHDLVSEFSAIRASQAPRRELQGIKAECLQSRALHSEPTSPARRDLISPLSPVKPTQQEPAHSPSHHYPQSTDYFPQPGPASYRDRSATSPIPPPLRSSSRAALPDYDHEAPLEEPTRTKAGLSESVYFPEKQLPTDTSHECTDYSAVPHAVTTPDNSALTLKSPPFRVPGAELADVPEEEDDERGTATSTSRPSTAGSGLRHTKSFPSIRSNSQSWSRSPRKAKTRDSGSQYSPSEECLSQSDMILPLVGEPDNDIPIRPRFSRHISLKAQGFDACWEDDIDYCYEHAAEADCEFDWDRVSLKDSEEPTNSGATSVLEGYQHFYQAPSPGEISSQYLPRLETSMREPSISSADSAKSSFSSFAGPTTPSYPLPSPRPYGLPAKTSAPTSINYPLSPQILTYKDSSSMLREDAYENNNFNKHDLEDPLPLHSLRFDPHISRDDSPRSSRSPISKCNSQESFMISRSSSFRYPRSTDSIGSLPDLVHSKSSRDGLNITREQVVELAATLKASETFLDQQQNTPSNLRPKTSQSLAKEVARQSMLQKAASFGSFNEEEEHEAEEVVVLPPVAHHERSQSAAVPQPAGPTHAQRKRSVTSAAAATKSRASYSLFPSPPLRSP